MAAARRFEAKEPTIYRDLQNTMRKLGATSLRVPRDLLDSKGVESEVVFDHGGRRYVVRCKKWSNWLDNFRAVERTIHFLYQAIADYGAVAVEQILAGFEATPDDSVLKLASGRQAWWEVLGVTDRATKPEIVNAYRSLARIHHPDVGGDAETFKRLREAYEQGLAAVTSGARP